MRLRPYLVQLPISHGGPPDASRTTQNKIPIFRREIFHDNEIKMYNATFFTSCFCKNKKPQNLKQTTTQSFAAQVPEVQREPNSYYCILPEPDRHHRDLGRRGYSFPSPGVRALGHEWVPLGLHKLFCQCRCECLHVRLCDLTWRLGSGSAGYHWSQPSLPIPPSPPAQKWSP